MSYGGFSFGAVWSLPGIVVGSGIGPPLMQGDRDR